MFMKLLKSEKTGLILMALGITLSILGIWWSILIIPGVIVTIIGALLWDPLGLILP
jgi:hypothetical protein